MVTLPYWFVHVQVDEVPYEVPYGPIFKYHVRLHGRGVMVAEGGRKAAGKTVT